VSLSHMLIHVFGIFHELLSVKSVRFHLFCVAPSVASFEVSAGSRVVFRSLVYVWSSPLVRLPRHHLRGRQIAWALEEMGHQAASFYPYYQ